MSSEADDASSEADDVSGRGGELTLGTKAWLKIGVREHDPVVPAELGTPPEAARLSLVSTGGATGPGQEPFATGKRGDASFRPISSSVDPDGLTFAHPHYDTSLAREDPDCIFPLRLLRRLAEEDVVGELAPTVYSMMGYVPITGTLRRETAPRIGELMQGEAVDAALLCPA